MASSGLLVRLEAKHGKDRDVERFLKSAVPLVEEELGTTSWFAMRFGRGAYGIFDTFLDDAAREEHLAGPVALALQQGTQSPPDAVVTVLNVLFPYGHTWIPASDWF